MRVHMLRHESAVGSGSVAAWTRLREGVITQTRLYADDPLPRLSSVDLIVVLGGSMGVHDYAAHPWLQAEKDFIWSALQHRARVLGLCLGAQLIADVLAARVARSRHPEVGWHAVHRTEAGEQSRLFAAWPKSLTAFMWHRDAFELPFGMLPVLRSAGCEFQGFTDDAGVVGLQFHPEVTPRWLAPQLADAPAPAVETPFVQAASQLSAGMAEHLPRARLAFFDLLDRFTGVGAGGDGVAMERDGEEASGMRA